LSRSGPPRRGRCLLTRGRWRRSARPPGRARGRPRPVHTPGPRWRFQISRRPRGCRTYHSTNGGGRRRRPDGRTFLHPVMYAHPWTTPTAVSRGRGWPGLVALGPLPRDLGLIAVEQARGDPAVDDCGQLPGQVVRVLNSAVQPESAARSVLVRSITARTTRPRTKSSATTPSDRPETIRPRALHPRSRTLVPSPPGLHLVTTWTGQGPCASCRESRGEELAMHIRLRHQDPVIPGAAAVSGGKTSHGARLARTLRARWWPRFTLAGAVLAVIGATVLSGAMQAWVALVGITVFLFRLADRTGGPRPRPRESSRRPPSDDPGEIE